MVKENQMNDENFLLRDPHSKLVYYDLYNCSDSAMELAVTKIISAHQYYLNHSYGDKLIAKPEMVGKLLFIRLEPLNKDSI